MFKRILIPLDGSTLSESIVPKVLRFLKVADAEVVLFRALPDVGLPRLDQNMILSKMEEDAVRYMGQVSHRLREMKIDSRSVVRRGDPGECILNVAKEERADLIAMSTHARGGVERWFFGSVAEKVRSHSPLPLLLLRAEEEPPRDWGGIRAGPYEKILLPLDGSSLAEEAIPTAQMLASSFGARLILFRTVSLPLLSGLEAPTLLDSLTAEAEEYLREVGSKVGGTVEARVEQGIPADMILSVADEGGADLIVMTTHGRSGLSRFLVGSVADRVVRGSWKPVLLIRSSRESGAG